MLMLPVLLTTTLNWAVAVAAVPVKLSAGVLRLIPAESPVPDRLTVCVPSDVPIERVPVTADPIVGKKFTVTLHEAPTAKEPVQALPPVGITKAALPDVAADEIVNE
jgi:hypothetical protein